MPPAKFPDFAAAVQLQFAEMIKADKLYIVDSDRDEIWTRYLAAFPPGTDPMFRKRTEHDCSCCRHFIRSVGNVVAIRNGFMSTVWDMTDLHPTYKAVAEAMGAYIRSCPVRDVFLTEFPKAGEPYSLEQPRPGSDDVVIRWEHFSAEIPKRFICPDPAAKQGVARASHDVLKRGVKELTPEAVSTVLDLIAGNQLYRGAEFGDAVASFQQLQQRVLTDDSAPHELLLWEMHDAKAAKIRNTAIGTLLQALSEGTDLEPAVKSFEAMVAPTHYKRPTSLITPRMIEDAMKTITELDLEPALERRHARLSDVSVTSVLWVDNSVKGRLKGGIAGKLMEEVQPAAFDPQKAKEIGIDEFLAMPHKHGIKLHLSNELLPNFVSMTAPVHPEAKSLFKWDNDFSWSYEGNVADSIKDKVKRAGGKVEGVALRTSLAWFNIDDLDLHCEGPYGLVYYANKQGILDVDMNVGGESRQPVENMRWVKPGDGRYQFKVHNFTRREPTDVGFVVEVESALGMHTFRYPKSVGPKETIPVCTVVVRAGRVIEVTPTEQVVVGQASQDCWGLKTLDLVRVNAVVLSPNYWDGNASGNKHWFFILEGCKNPQPCRGIYNEFLHPRLEKHRKVFEILGAKTKCPVVEEQLSGVGFSSTRKDRVVVTSGGTAYAIQF